MNKIDYFSPGTIMAFIAVVMVDFFSLFTIGILIPGIGLVIGAYFLLAVVFTAFLLIFLVFPQMKHLLPKLTLLLFFPLRIVLGPVPIPILSIGLILALLMQNRFVEFAVSQAALIGLEVATAGTATPIVAGAEVARGAQVAGRGAQVARGAVATERGIQAERGAQATTARGFATEDIYTAPEAGLKKGLFEETPDTPTRSQKVGQYAQEKIRDIRDRDLGIDTRPEEEPEEGVDDETIDLREDA